MKKMNINQRYRHGTLFCGDCITIMKTLPAESIRIIVTSPPYNLKTRLEMA
ncbi:hypothetical protein [Arsenophonus sp. ENCA]|uniref:hypothetical protein n=1 Tax=Arsenophonus sp. ENCA TaxID=1987579 RepID=UPI0025BD033E|nr:hypothetical protein [Arsenophonus sp. ENCA]